MRPIIKGVVLSAGKTTQRKINISALDFLALLFILVF
jgi:hypothetical protein